jgi:chromosome partitioning protein
LTSDGATDGACTVADWLAGRTGPVAQVAGERGLALLLGTDTALPVQTPPMQTGADWTLIDSAPAWSDQTATLAHWADIILCPLEPDFLGLSGVSRLLQRFDAVDVPRARLRFLLCRYTPRIAVHQQVMARLTERLGADLVVPVPIRNSVRLAEAPGFGRSIFAHAPRSTGAADYLSLAAYLAQSRAALTQKAAS